MFSTRLQTLLVAGALGPIFFGSDPALAQTKKAPAHKTVKTDSRTVQLPPGSRIIIENEAGDITVEGWEKPQCEIHSFKASTVPDNLDKIKVTIEEEPNRLRLKTTYEGKLAGDNSVNYILSVPAVVDLQIRNIHGRIQIRELNGRIALNSERGDLLLKNIVGAVDGKTESGNITLELQRPVTRDISLKTDEGAVQLNLAKDLNAFVWAESEEGKVQSSLKFQELFIQESNILKGQVGQGGKLVRLQSGRGEIRLLAATESSSPARQARDTRPPSAMITDGKDSPKSGAEALNVEANPELAPIPPPSSAVEPPPKTVTRDATSPTISAKKPEPPPNFRAKLSSPALPRAASGTVTIKVDTNLISMNTNVRDRFSGKSLLGLKQEDFDLYEDNVRQEISYFRPVETPFHLLLLLDISGSIEEKFDVIQEASIRFIQLLKPQDRIAIATFNHDFQLVRDFTNDRKDLARAILEIVPGGGTAFYDAMDHGVNSVMGKISGRRAIVVFTDGVDNQHMPDLRQYGSVGSFPQLYRAIEESDITIYSIFLNTEGDPRSGVVTGANSVWDAFDSSSIVGDVLGIKKRRSNTAQKKKNTVAGTVHSNLYANAIDELNKIAEQTGGKIFAPSAAHDMNGIYEQVVDDLSNQYSLGYYPSNPAIDGTWRKITVKLKDRLDTIVKGRKGYYARLASGTAKKGRTLDLGRPGVSGEDGSSPSQPKRRVF